MLLVLVGQMVVTQLLSSNLFTRAHSMMKLLKTIKMVYGFVFLVEISLRGVQRCEDVCLIGDVHIFNQTRKAFL